MPVGPFHRVVNLKVDNNLQLPVNAERDNLKRIVRKRSGLEVTRAQSLLGDMNSAVFGRYLGSNRGFRFIRMSPR